MMYLSINKNKKFNNNVSENLLRIFLISFIIEDYTFKKGECSFAKYIINIVIMNENVFLKM